MYVSSTFSRRYNSFILFNDTELFDTRNGYQRPYANGKYILSKMVKIDNKCEYDVCININNINISYFNSYSMNIAFLLDEILIYNWIKKTFLEDRIRIYMS